MAGGKRWPIVKTRKRAAEDAGAKASSSSRNSKATKSQSNATAGKDAPAEPSSSNQNDGGDKEKPLKPDSEYKDLGLVMIEYIRLGEEWEDFEEDGWVKNIISYALKYEIDLAFTDSFKKDWGSKRKQRGDPSELPDPTSKKNDPWDWKKKVRALERKHAMPKTPHARTGTLGGTYFDVTKWTKKQRADAAHDGKDPIPPEIIQAIKEGCKVALR
ncbi:hypothetical protein MBLNU457_3186t3 [Dothideomycetes sp. NU457]